ncbi:SAP domain-containing protein [Pseudozyma hubeiensis]|nr:SAP domain-containing protein [Pseudozyma hubeiensis]
MASSLTVEELRSRLHNLGLDTKGKKADLKLRLKKAIRNGSSSPPNAADAVNDADTNWEPEFDTFLVLDVEATCEATRKYRNLQHGYETGCFQYPNEIIEFPVVLLKWNQDSHQLDTVDVFHSYVRPTFRPRLTKFCRDLTGVTQSQVDAAPLWNDVVTNFFHFLQSHNLVEDTSTGKPHLHHFRLRRGIAWINHGPADLRDFVIKQSWISGRPADKDHGSPPIFLRGPLVDIRKGIASLFKWEQELKAEQSRSNPRSTTIEFGGEDGFQVIPPSVGAASGVKEDARTSGLSPYEQSLAGLLELLDIGPFQGRQHCGLDDTKNIARLVVEVARRISLAAKGKQVLLSKSYESVDGQMESSAAVMELDAKMGLARARQMEKLVLKPNVRLDGFHKRFFWMGKAVGEVKWPFPPEEEAAADHVL